jgi:protein O-mannosyl-transferase
MRPGAPSRRCKYALAVAAITAAVWAPSVRGGFVWDDQHDLIRSERLHRLGAVVEVFRHHAMWSAEQPETAIATYRPLALATLAVDYQLWRLRPAGYHATNVALHVLATLAVLLALAQLLGDVRAGAALALLFAVHPANAEAVAWINGRSEMLALGFGALALWAAATGRFVVTAVALWLAMLGKETGALFAPLAIAVAILNEQTSCRRRRTAVAVVAAAVVAVGAYAVMRVAALGGSGLPAHDGAARALGPVLARATFAALVPLRRAPVELSTWLAALSPAARAGWLAAGLALLALLALLLARRHWLAAIGLAWWLLAIAPTAPIAALDYPWPGLARWLYVGLPGLLVALYSAARRLAPRPRAALAVAAAAFLVVAAQRAILVWRSDDALYATMVAESPDDAWAWRALGTARLAAARWSDAADCFHRAATCDRTEEVHAAYALEAYAWTFLGRCDEAVAQFNAHPATPALKSEDFEAAAAACRARRGNAPETR